MSTGRLQGIFTPNLVAFDDAGNINEAETRRYVDWLVERYFQVPPFTVPESSTTVSP